MDTDILVQKFIELRYSTDHPTSVIISCLLGLVYEDNLEAEQFFQTGEFSNRKIIAEALKAESYSDPNTEYTRLIMLNRYQ